MRKFFASRDWTTAGAVAAGVYGLPFLLEHLVSSPDKIDADTSATDWDAALRALLNS